MRPSVYLYKESIGGVELYLGEFSTLQGLSLLEPEAELQLTNLSATCYKEFGWATERDLPKLSNVKAVIAFLKNEGNIGIVEFESELPNIGSLSTHDDGECHFRLKSKSLAISILTQVAPEKERDVLINQLLNNQDFYITCDNSGVINKFGSFDDYLANNT